MALVKGMCNMATSKRIELKELELDRKEVKRRVRELNKPAPDGEELTFEEVNLIILEQHLLESLSLVMYERIGKLKNRIEAEHDSRN